MRQTITLYIDGQRADCDTGSLILMNYTREELENPTIVRNSYSQGVTLPATATNNKIFSHYYRQDYVTGGGNFSALARVPFLLQSDTGEVLERGYLRLVSVAYTGAVVHSYSVQLYGGLGGFFYGLTYNEDGSKKTLADLRYRMRFEQGDPEVDLDEQFPLNALAVKQAWDDLADHEENEHQFINFAPCYNGLPSCKFSADKAVYKAGETAATRMQNLYTSKDGYGPMTGANGYILVELENEHTEWEMQDLRAYLQRPILRVQHLLESLCWNVNTPGYTFALDTWQLFNEDYWYFMKSWLTLPLIDRDKVDPRTTTIRDLLANTATPADYLIGFAKMFGCVFNYDAVQGRITLMCRDQYYSTGLGPIDLTERIDKGKGRTITPFPFAHKFYDFALPMVGEFSARYAEKYGRVFGSQRVDTGYEFDAETENLLDGIVYKGCNDAIESNRHYCVFGGAADPETGGSINYNLKFAFTEKVSWRLYKTADGQTEELDCEPTAQPLRTFLYGDGYADFLPKPQLHGEDNKAEDGANILLLFNGWVDTPADIQGGFAIDEVDFRLTDDVSAMATLNAGEPCWNVTPSDGQLVQSLPSFRRWNNILGSEPNNMLDFGRAREYITPEVPGEYAGTMYESWWKAYIEDRYDKDSRVLKCWCDLRGLGDVSALLRRFFFYEGSIWTLNKISNHSLTTLDTTECEFIRVQDTANYTDGQFII